MYMDLVSVLLLESLHAPTKMMKNSRNCQEIQEIFFNRPGTPGPCDLDFPRWSRQRVHRHQQLDVRMSFNHHFRKKRTLLGDVLSPVHFEDYSTRHRDRDGFGTRGRRHA